MNITTNSAGATPEYKEQLDALIVEAFGFSFHGWFRQQVWNDDYTCYSIIENGRMLANVSVYKMDMLVNGQDQVWFQIGAVATRKANRGEGLSKKIMDFILDRYSDTPFILFANESVINFYPRFGFKRILDRQPIVKRNLIHPSGEMKKLSVKDPAIGNYLNHRLIFSEILDCKNAAPIHWFHLLLEYPDKIYEIPSLQTMLVMEQEGSALTILDLWSKTPVTFDEIIPHLNFPGTTLIKFGFNPDGLKAKYQTIEHECDSAIFIKGKPQIPDDFIFPVLIQT